MVAIETPHETGPIARRPARRRAGTQTIRDSGWSRLTPYLLVLPVLVLMLLFIYWPLVYSFYLATLEWNFVSPTRTFVGLHNFTALATDKNFRTALGNTGLYLLVLVPVQVLLPLAFAVLLGAIVRSRAQTAYRAVLFTPTVMALPVAAVCWLWIFNPIQGVLNKLLFLVGGSRVSWLTDPKVAIWCIITVAIWKALGFNLLLYLAALEAVPPEYLEAAALDGAGGWALFWRIKWPLITPTFFFVLVTTVIFINDEAFAAINVLTDGGPFQHTTNVLYYLYERGFRFFQVGQASAVSVLVVLAVMTLTWLQFRFVEGRVYYA